MVLFQHHRERGYTLIELVITIIITGIVASSVVVAMGAFMEHSKEAITRKEMLDLVKAIKGEHSTGQPGYEGNMGRFPTSLGYLVANDWGGAADPAYNSFTNTGWNGPYIETNESQVIDPTTNKQVPWMLLDAWAHQPMAGDDGTTHMYTYDNGTGTITSAGRNGIAGDGDDITIQIDD